MSASKTNFFQGIVLLLTEMSKPFTNLSKRVKKSEENLQKTEDQMDIIIKQHVDLVKQIKMISMLQTDIANQILQQHESVEELYKALGLKKDLSYYSFDLMNQEEH